MPDVTGTGLETDKLKNLLMQIATLTLEMATAGLVDGTYKPDIDVHYRLKHESFEYTEKGVTPSSGHIERFTEQSWDTSSTRLADKLKQSGEYKTANTALKALLGDRYRSDRFVDLICTSALANSRDSEAGIESALSACMNDFTNEDVAYRASVPLSGIILGFDSVEISHGVRLRRPGPVDVDEEIPLFGMQGSPLVRPPPSAILEISIMTRNAQDLQTRTSQVVAALRLFKVGDVRYSLIHMDTDSVTDAFGKGSMGTGESMTTNTSYIVTGNELQRLGKFWHELEGRLPRSIYDVTVSNQNYISNAYGRYRESLSEYGTYERRIADAVMGIEALLLKPSEKQELAYRLGMRLSRFLSLFGFDPLPVRKEFTSLYEIRSIFAHGGLFDYSMRKKFERKNGEFKVHLETALNYLRMLILAMMLSGRDKEELIDLVDDSMLVRSLDPQLLILLPDKSLLASAKVNDE